MNINEQEGRGGKEGCVVCRLEIKAREEEGEEGCVKPPVNHFTVPANPAGQRS